MELEPSRRLSPASLVGMAVLVAGCLLFPLVSLWGFIGPYAWISGFQAETFGRVYLRSTAFFLILSSIPVAVLGLLLLGSIGVWRDRGGRAWLFPWDQDPFWSERARAWSKLHLYTIVLGVFALLLGVLSLGEAGLAIGFRSHESFEAETAEAGKLPQGKWLRAFGRPLVDKSVKVSDGSEGSLEDRYVPVVSPGWNATKPIGVFIKVTTRHFDAMLDQFRMTNYQGLWFRPGLPPPVRSEFAKNELVITDRPVVVDWEKHPSDHAWTGAIESLFAALLAAGAILLYRSRRVAAVASDSPDARAA